MSASKLTKPSVDYKESYLEALALYHKEGRYLHLDPHELKNNFENFVNERCSRRSEAYRNYDDWVEIVPDTILWLVKDDEYLGSIKIRHRLNWHLEKWGGHLSLIVRPDMRLKGHGQKIFRKVKPALQALKLERALMTVSPENNIARHILEKIGARYEDELSETDNFPAQCRYWWNI